MTGYPAVFLQTSTKESNMDAQEKENLRLRREFYQLLSCLKHEVSETRRCLSPSVDADAALNRLAKMQEALDATSLQDAISRLNGE
jgi:hypothetical protein